MANEHSHSHTGEHEHSHEHSHAEKHTDAHSGHHEHHEHSHSHHHHHGDLRGKKLALAVIMNLATTVAQIIGGIISNSLSLLSDALHNLSDGIALWLAYITERISKKDATENKTFGYKRAQILSAFVNSFVLIFICIFLFYEAYQRFLHPEEVNSTILISVAIFGLLANLISVFMLFKDKDENINIKSAYLHLLGDTLSSVAVILGGIVMMFYKVYWLDPLLTVLIAAYILKETYSVFWDTINILMQTTPTHIDIDEIVHKVSAIKEVKNIHHVHLWSLDDKDVHFECHLDLNEDLKLSEIDKIRAEVELILLNDFEINHVTIQTEYNCCDEKELIVSHNHNHNHDH